MSNEDKMPTWLEVFKGMPAYTAENFRLFVAYWKAAPAREWIVETLWLIILVSMFYYGVHGTIYAMHTASDAGVDPNGPIGWLLTFAPFILVFAIFMVHWAFSSGVRILFNWLDNRGS